MQMVRVDRKVPADDGIVKLAGLSQSGFRAGPGAMKKKGLAPFRVQVLDSYGAPGRIRTHDPLVRSQVL